MAAAISANDPGGGSKHDRTTKGLFKPVALSAGHRPPDLPPPTEPEAPLVCARLAPADDLCRAAADLAGAIEESRASLARGVYPPRLQAVTGALERFAALLRKVGPPPSIGSRSRQG